MGKFGEAAILATKLVNEKSIDSPRTAWNMAVEKVFPKSKSSRDKGCPRNAYLGLCEMGFVNGVSAGDYTRSVSNKTYAGDAINILKQNPSLVNDPDLLWEKVMQGTRKAHNSQMDVVTSLWINGMIIK